VQYCTYYCKLWSFKDGWFGKRKRATESRADKPCALAEKRENLT
jgi:hypothetical protein